mgnify:CR=1 FL=1
MYRFPVVTYCPWCTHVNRDANGNPIEVRVTHPSQREVPCRECAR